MARRGWLILRYIALAYIWLAVAFIFFGYGLIWYSDGFSRLTEIMSPLNVINWIAVVATVLPGVLLMQWADRHL